MGSEKELECSNCSVSSHEFSAVTLLPRGFNKSANRVQLIPSAFSLISQVTDGL